MNTQTLKKYIPYSILFISIITLNPYSSFKIGNTFTSWIIEFFILYLFLVIKPYLKSNSTKNEINIISLYLFYNSFSIIRGFFIVESYWDVKDLTSHGLALLLPIVAFSGTSPNFIKIVFQFYLKYTLPLLILFYFIIIPGAIGFYLAPISCLVLFLPVLRKPWNIILASLCVFVIVVDLSARSNVIKFFVPIILSLLYYFRFNLSISFLNMIRKLLFLFPFILFTLAISGVFNVFKISEYISGNYHEVKLNSEGESITEDLTTDTRTFLYKDVLSTAFVYDSWLIGRSPARGNISEQFASSDLNGRGERSANEVAILNIFTWTGCVGVFFYLFIFYKATYLAINKSNNIFIKIVGLFIAFRWCYSWVEDVNNFTLNFFMLWIMIGICFSKTLRKMNDKEFEYWINSIFRYKYKY